MATHSDTPTVAAQTAGAGSDASASVSGADTAGTLTVTTQSGVERRSHSAVLTLTFALLEPGNGELMFLGYGESSDAHHMSAPDPEGRGASSAMRAALGRASLEPREIDYINLHGTATPANDAAWTLPAATIRLRQADVAVTGFTLRSGVTRLPRRGDTYQWHYVVSP